MRRPSSSLLSLLHLRPQQNTASSVVKGQLIKTLKKDLSLRRLMVLTLVLQDNTWWGTVCREGLGGRLRVPGKGSGLARKAALFLASLQLRSVQRIRTQGQPWLMINFMERRHLVFVCLPSPTTVLAKYTSRALRVTGR